MDTKKAGVNLEDIRVHEIVFTNGDETISYLSFTGKPEGAWDEGDYHHFVRKLTAEEEANYGY
ncbi:MAG: hypothetical protein GF409_07405 [Candidatus Omnitrophica bacterium]|nr:hypothetical protein [Candidatus Omnitrophota bacterium]